MSQRIMIILFVICVVMGLSAGPSRSDDKKKQLEPVSNHQQGNREASRNNESAAHTQNQSHREAPVQVTRRESPPVETRENRFVQPENRGPRVYAVAQPSAPVENNNLFHRQHHKTWQPLYNFYDNQYHFYPYVNIASTVELPADCVSIVYDGQTFYFDRGTFYLQDAQGQFEAVSPPVGIIVNALPSWARQFNVDGQVYYRCKGIFYVQVPQGYQVVNAIQVNEGDS